MSLEEAQKILDPKTVALISNYRLLARLMIDGYFVGQHRGPRHAFSLEYSKHREYYPGDSLKLVDWKLFAKSDRYFVKQFEEETNLQAWFLMDISQSMAYQGTNASVSKLRYACYLAGALAYLMLGQKDLAGMMFFDSKIRKVIPPSSALRQLNLLLKELKNVQAGEVSNLEESAKLMSSRIKRRGLILLFSDFLAHPDEIERTLKHLMHRGSEVLVFQILSHDEIHFPFRRFQFFEDMETKERVLLQPDFIKQEYQKQIQKHMKAIKDICMKFRLSYQMLETITPFDQGIRTFLEARRKLH